MPAPNQRRPRRIDLDEHARYAEERFARYVRTTKDLLFQAENASRSGAWSDAANSLHAALESVAAAAGVCRELNLLYLMKED